MKINLIFQHGWGFNKDLWRRIIPFTGNYRVSLADRGYLGNGVATEPSEKQFNIAIVHSFGLHLIEKNFDKIGLLVVLAGFKHFHGESRQDGMFSKKHIRRMLVQVNEDPHGLLNNFYNDCSYINLDADIASINIDILKGDLLLLDTQSADIKKINKIPNVLVIHGDMDRVVPLDRGEFLAECIENSKFEVVSGAGHGLPFTHPKICWQLIQDSINSI